MIGGNVTNSELQELLELFGQEQACYTVLLDLLSEQIHVLEKGLPCDDITFTQQKQEAIEKVQQLADTLKPMLVAWPAIRATLDQEERQILDLALSTIEEQLSELIASERRVEILLELRNASSDGDRLAS